MSEQIEIEESRQGNEQMIDENDQSENQYQTPNKCEHFKEQNSILTKTSPSFFLNQVQDWRESLEKYKNDPQIAQVITQMNETIQFHPQTPVQENYDSPRKLLDDQSFSVMNHSFKFDVFQKLNENINQIYDELQNQSCQSPRTVDLSRRCNETCSEIKQQVSEIERVCKNKDEELCFLSQQFDKDFSQNKYLRDVKSDQVPQNILQGEIWQKYSSLKEKRKKSANLCRKKQQGNILELRQSLTQLKKEVENGWPKQISIFKDDLISEASRFCLQNNNSPQNENQEQLTLIEKLIENDLKNQENTDKIENYEQNQLISKYYELRELFQQQILELREVIQEKGIQSQQIRKGNNAKSEIIIDESFWSQMQQVTGLDEGIIDGKKQETIAKALFSRINNQQLQIDNFQQNQEVTQKNQELRLLQLQNEWSVKIQEQTSQTLMIKCELSNAQNTNQQLNLVIQQYKNKIDELTQELEQERLRDLVTLNIDLVKLGHKSIKQEQQLIYITSRIFQQLLVVTSKEKDIESILQEKVKIVELSASQLNEMIQKDQTQVGAKELIGENSTTVDEIIITICNEYRQIIEEIKASQLNWIKQFQ